MLTLGGRARRRRHRPIRCSTSSARAFEARRLPAGAARRSRARRCSSARRAWRCARTSRRRSRPRCTRRCATSPTRRPSPCSPRTSASCCWRRPSDRSRCWASIRGCAPAASWRSSTRSGALRRLGAHAPRDARRQGRRGADPGRPGEEGRHRARSPSATAPPGRETETFVREALRHFGIDVPVVMVSEAGASVYSASDVAREEFPELDVTVRGAISIARRLQDPLAELVKIDPKSIGVGQYQHDVSQTGLKKSLDDVVESCVNQVGVEREHRVVPPARRTSSGIGPGAGAARSSSTARRRGCSSRATACSRCRASRRRRSSRRRASCASAAARNPLDNTGVHPERYARVERLAARPRRRRPRRCSARASSR